MNALGFLKLYPTYAGLVAFPILCVVGTLYYIGENSTNHSALDFVLLIVPLSILAIIALFKIRKRPKFLIALIANLTAIAFYLYIDHYNIMLGYNEWLYRGMPERYEKSDPKPDNSIKDPEYLKLQKQKRKIYQRDVEGKYKSDEDFRRDLDPILEKMKPYEDEHR